MAGKKPISPIIVIGMHRSGTSMLSSILEQCGVYMGADQDHNKESLFFQRQNKWLLSQAGIRWDSPENFKFITEDFKKLSVEILNNHLKSLRRLSYLGWRKSIKYRSIFKLDIAWGWKDPRNTYTIDIWSRIFPNAKVIHIYRNPMDVIGSLYNREDGSILVRGVPTRTGLRKRYYGYKLPFKRLYPQSFRVMDLSGSFNLWKDYVNKSLSIDKTLQSKQCLHLSYEDILENPLDNIRRLLSFIGHSDQLLSLESIAGGINTKRKLAFLLDPKLLEFFKNIKDDKLLVKLGYQNLDK